MTLPKGPHAKIHTQMEKSSTGWLVNTEKKMQHTWLGWKRGVRERLRIPCKVCRSPFVGAVVATCWSSCSGLGGRASWSDWKGTGLNTIPYTKISHTPPNSNVTWTRPIMYNVFKNWIWKKIHYSQESFHKCPWLHHPRGSQQWLQIICIYNMNINLHIKHVEREREVCSYWGRDWFRIWRQNQDEERKAFLPCVGVWRRLGFRRASSVLALLPTCENAQVQLRSVSQLNLPNYIVTADSFLPSEDFFYLFSNKSSVRSFLAVFRF